MIVAKLVILYGLLTYWLLVMEAREERERGQAQESRPET
ncbi:hypothetical protein PBI_EQUEMIOH13_63 [Mycobacterium phage Equemioh13]|uniref:Uncharacterized protein n=1 Tax=Mycobacterium phage Piro94 TaxID=1527520 RepID=A0A076YMB7_9CAUD|nr:hypothetical protein AVV38_gp40 [Mycobacterium phage Piro94]YP_009203332.1 hypothetical protein AVT12_gp43 [Mycobacterium phage Equemioh13]AOZ64006.1 hypothetical protein SEA_BAEHEXIC_62 [Mycobacterium phage Baehexic]ATN92296.1 hypothetical protein SEA_UPDAWG_64 [Mycobacterium phage Updawg]QDM57265.1 hypothetical protein SEA_WIDEWALE_64 [Mycobacterium phage WideWale]UJD20992.1 hypothetical protein SEA_HARRYHOUDINI_64 [Mycobacterium phage HarryHoudini]AIK67779.1 hypothetical protein PBI_PIR